VAESSDARRAPLSPPTACRPTPITTTALPFTVQLDTGGTISVRLVTQAPTAKKGVSPLGCTRGADRGRHVGGGDGGGYGGGDPLAAERCGAYLGLLVGVGGLKPVREREAGPAPTLEGGPPGAPHRERISERGPLPAPPARQHNIPRRSFHATPFVRWRQTISHTYALRAT